MTIMGHVFCVHISSLLNFLPDRLRNLTLSCDSFKKLRKTELFYFILFMSHQTHRTSAAGMFQDEALCKFTIGRSSWHRH